MHQRGQMHHLDDDRRRHVRVGGFAGAAHAGRQRDERGAQMFAAAVQHIFCVRNDLRIEFVNLFDKSL